jgi:hypothetical protein
MRALPQLLELSPSVMTLELLSREVSALDVDDAIEQSVVLERALLVQTLWNEPHQWFARPWRNTVPQPWWQLLRPWLAHRAVALIAIMNEQQQGARQPWPDRLRADGPLPQPARSRFVRAITARYLAAVPIDPYSGEEMRYRRGPDRVVVYSVGKNRKDDGGEKLGDGPSRGWAVYREDQPPPDIGLVMRLSVGSEKR